VAKEREDRLLAVIRGEIAGDDDLSDDYITRCAALFNKPADDQFAKRVRSIIFGISYHALVGPRDRNADLEIWKLVAKDPLGAETLARLSEEKSAGRLVRSYFEYSLGRTKRVTTVAEIVSFASRLKMDAQNAVALASEGRQRRRPINHGFHLTMESIVRVARLMGDDLSVCPVSS
jgi:hypothetical protein